MKKLLYFFAIISSLLIIQCSNDVPNSANQDNLELGKVSLRIDKQNAPDGVVLVEACLTREGQDSLFGALNILSSNSADISFDDVAVGDWHLEVNAKDNNGVILYSGETDLTVQAGILTQVNLVLTPTGQGTGSIYIFVSWGQANNSWIDYYNNPVLGSQNTYYDMYGVYQPTLIRENNLYRLWYVGDAGTAIKHVLYAESTNGIDSVSTRYIPFITRTSR